MSHYCPACGSKDVEFEMDGLQECMNCGFKGKDFPEEHLLIEEEEQNADTDLISKIKKRTISDDEDEIVETKTKKAKKGTKKVAKKKTAKKAVKKTTKKKVTKKTGRKK